MWQILAPELVFGILRHFLPAGGLKLSVIEPALFPWYLGQICSSWREVFISYPEFWNNLVIHLQSHRDKNFCTTIGVDANFNRALAILNTCLPRSRNCPLSFQFILYSDELCYGPENSKSRCSLQILELLVGESTRWRDAHIELHESGLPVYMVEDKLPSFTLCGSIYGPPSALTILLQ